MIKQSYGEWMRSNPPMLNISAVEWLTKRIFDWSEPNEHMKSLIEKAKQMEKEQIAEAYLQGSFDDGPNQDNAEQYYNETYGGQGSPDTSPNTQNK